MPEAITLTDADFKATIEGNKPVLLLLTTDSSIRGDFNTAFKKAIDEHKNILFFQMDATKNPEASEYFEVGSKPLLVVIYGGEQLVRRTRPWGSDVPLSIELLKNAMKDTPPVKESVAESVSAEEEAEIEAEVTAEVEEADAIVEGKPIKVTDDTFEELVLNSPIPVLVDYWAEWCGPCRMVAPVLEKLAKEYAGKVRIAKVNTDENPGLSQHFRIMSIPTIQMIKDRTIVFSQPGALPEPAFRSLLDQLITLEIPAQDEDEDDEIEEVVDDEVEEVVNEVEMVDNDAIEETEIAEAVEEVVSEVETVADEMVNEPVAETEAVEEVVIEVETVADEVVDEPVAETEVVEEVVSEVEVVAELDEDAIEEVEEIVNEAELMEETPEA